LLVVYQRTALFLGVIAFMPESPRYLAVRGRGREAMDVLRRIAAWNGNAGELPRGVELQVLMGNQPVHVN
jgi:hypothetical protein